MPENMNEEQKQHTVDFSKRAFLKAALLGGATVASTAALAKVAAKMRPRADFKAAYLNDDLQQEKVMKDKQYVLMTKEEKEDMVRVFENDYKYTA